MTSVDGDLEMGHELGLGEQKAIVFRIVAGLLIVLTSERDDGLDGGPPAESFDLSGLVWNIRSSIWKPRLPGVLL